MNHNDKLWLARCRHAGTAAGALFAAEFPGVHYTGAEGDWDAAAWENDQPADLPTRLADRAFGSSARWSNDSR